MISNLLISFFTCPVLFSTVLSKACSELNVPDTLAGLDGRNVNINGQIATFNTFLKLVVQVGMHDELTSSGPYLHIAPSEEACAALSQVEKDALLNDPQTIKTLLNAHFVGGYYPYDSISGVVYGHSGRDVTNRLRRKLHFEEDSLNGKPIGTNYSFGNGNRVQIF